MEGSNQAGNKTQHVSHKRIRNKKARKKTRTIDTRMFQGDEARRGMASGKQRGQDQNERMVSGATIE